MKIIFTKQKGGYAMLFAVLLSSLLIALGMSIFNLSIKELQIATSERDSQISYYSAYSAYECYRYWLTQGAFPPHYNISQGGFYPTSGQETDTINCNGGSNNTPFIFTCSQDPFTSDISCSNFASPATFYYTTSTDLLSPSASIVVQRLQHGFSIVSTSTMQGHNSGIIGKRVERGILKID
jgi:hypothetical protein